MSDEKEPLPSAFPNGNLFKDNRGLTIRDYFAAKAMNGLLCDLPKTMYGLDWKNNLVRSAYEIADAMMAAREGK